MFSQCLKALREWDVICERFRLQSTNTLCLCLYTVDSWTSLQRSRTLEALCIELHNALTLAFNHSVKGLNNMQCEGNVGRLMFGEVAARGTWPLRQDVVVADEKLTLKHDVACGKSPHKDPKLELLLRDVSSTHLRLVCLLPQCFHRLFTLLLRDTNNASLHNTRIVPGDSFHAIAQNCLVIERDTSNGSALGRPASVVCSITFLLQRTE